MNENELQKSDSENEILSADDKRLHEMLCGLKKVNAPKNFDFHLKAKIAKANPEDFQTASLLPFLRYFLPFSVVILLAVFVGFNLFLTNQQNAETEVAKTTVKSSQLQENPVTITPKVEASTISANVLPTQANFVQPDDKTVAASNSAKKIVNAETTQNLTNKRGVSPKENNSNEKVFSRDSALGLGEVLTPKGIPPIFNSPKKSVENSEEKIKETLKFIGITAVPELGKWKVIAVDANNMAARSGIQIGDFVETIDGIKLNENSAENFKFSLKIIQIIRKGKSISLELNR
ncbi:MAG TPA: hypothetical protein PKY59_27230 [Pyrinomonadaceae bacterium]|nr:hypothetical protein [Pyrinomonadaceae bacterium]